jgi:hypothetical protein
MRKSFYTLAAAVGVRKAVNGPEDQTRAHKLFQETKNRKPHFATRESLRRFVEKGRKRQKVDGRGALARRKGFRNLDKSNISANMEAAARQYDHARGKKPDLPKKIRQVSGLKRAMKQLRWLATGKMK